MARKKGHHRLKPEVNPITYIILGITFVILTLAIILSVESEQQKFDKLYNLENHNYEVITLDKLDKKVKAEENVLVIFQVHEEEQVGNPQVFLEELLKIYNKDDKYNDNNLSDKVDKIMFVKVLPKDGDKFTEFVDNYDVIHLDLIMILYFEEDALVAEVNLTKQHDDNHEQGVDSIEMQNLKKNLNEFLEALEN